MPQNKSLFSPILLTDSVVKEKFNMTLDVREVDIMSYHISQNKSNILNNGNSFLSCRISMLWNRIFVTKCPIFYFHWSAFYWTFLCMKDLLLVLHYSRKRQNESALFAGEQDGHQIRISMSGMSENTNLYTLKFHYFFALKKLGIDCPVLVKVRNSDC